MREVNINIEGYNVNGICVGCLNYGRKMSYDPDIEKCFKLVANIDVSDGLSIQVCWECLAAVQSVFKFQSTILASYDVLISYSKQHTFLNSPSDLAIHAKQRLAISSQHEKDIVDIKTEEPTDNLIEVTEIKTEIDDEKVEFEENIDYPDSTNYEQDDYQENNSINYNDYSMDPKSDADDDDIQLSKLKEQKKKRSRHEKKRKKTENVKNEELINDNDKFMKKLKNLPQEAVELILVDEEEMWKLRKDDIDNYFFAKLKYRCDKCVLSFNSEKLMLDHLSGKHSPKNKQAIQCDICQVYLLTKDSFKQHRSAHLSVYACKKCLYRSCSKKLMANHLDREHAANEEVRCKTCGELFSTKSKLSYHKNVCKQEKPQCDCCGKVFANKITLKYHLKILPASKPDDKDEKPKKKLSLACPGCGKIFRSKKSYRAHVVIHDGLLYPCSLCGKQFQWKRNLARHMRNHRDKEAGALHECRQCGKRFSSRDCYNNHMRFSKKHVAEDKLTHQCTYCGKKFATKWCMMDHIDWDHLKNIKYQCNSCLKPFKTAKILVAHVNNIHGNKTKEPDGQHLCDICGKYYKSVKRLKGHVSAMHTHRSTTKSYRCHFCPATFTWQTSIYKHLKMMHEWPRKDQRNKPFKTAKILVAHVNNIHGNKTKEPDGQHLCDICGKYYKSVKRLKGHVSAMHTHRSTTKSYRCHFCPATFTWQTSIYKHLKMMHEWPRKDQRNKPRPVAMQPKKETHYPDIQPSLPFYSNNLQIVNISNSQISINLPSNSVTNLVNN